MDKWLKNTNVIKILSLVFGIMLWLVVGTSPNTLNKDMPIGTVETKYVYDSVVTVIYDEDKYALDILTDKVEVTLKGNSSAIEKIRRGTNIDDVRIFINLEDYDTGSYEVPIEYSGFPSGITVSTDPITASVNLEAKQTKEFSVIVEKLGKEKEGFQAGDPIINPKKVFIFGTKAQIEKVSFVKAYVNIDNINNPISQEIQLLAIDNSGKIVDVEINPKVVNVQIPISSPYLTVPLTYKIDKYPPEGYAVQSINLLTDKVIIYGDNEIISKYIAYSGFKLDLSNITSNKKIKIDLSKDDALLKIEPTSIDIEVNIVESIIKKYSLIPIDIIGLPNGLMAEINTQDNTTDLTIEAAPSVINSINASDLQTFVDVSNLPVGEHKVLLQYNIPIYAKNISEKSYIDVVITKE